MKKVRIKLEIQNQLISEVNDCKNTSFFQSETRTIVLHGGPLTKPGTWNVAKLPGTSKKL